MNISYNWLQQYLRTNHSPEELSEILTAIGLEVEGVDLFESIPGGLAGLITGKVIDCVSHPNADKLSLTKVDVGESEPLSIVCGAPNVAVGQMVVVAPVGTTIHPVSGDSFQIKKAKIRGEISEGMICAEDEIGLGSSHDGIMVLQDDVRTGMPAKELFEVETDTIFEIGLTPNRSDATSHLGVAKDLAAYLKVNDDPDTTVKIPEAGTLAEGDSIDFTVKVLDPIGSPRYAGIVLGGIDVRESPAWLKNRLKSIGVRPLNNVVDITNFVLHELGQPLHAFDLDCIQGSGIVVSRLEEGTPFTTLDEKKRTLSAEDLMICDAKMTPLCMAGVFGGLGSGVTNKTTKIFLESAHFNSTSIRKTSTRHLLRTDAAKIFEKGSDPDMVVKALKRAAGLLTELAGATVNSPLFDIYPKAIEPKKIRLHTDKVRRLIGTSVSDREISRILMAMNMNLVTAEDGIIDVTVPLNKADVTREADLVEEILRIYGYDKVPFSDSIKIPLIAGNHPDSHTLKNRVADFLSANGLLQMMNLSLVRSDLYGEGKSDLVYIHNTSNESLNTMRPDMLHSALVAVAHNLNRRQRNLKLYEFGRTYSRQDHKILEREHLIVILTGSITGGNWRGAEKQADFYDLMNLVKKTLLHLGIQEFEFTKIKDSSFLQYGTELKKGNRSLAIVGLVDAGETKKHGIHSDVFFADLNWVEIQKLAIRHNVISKPVSKFPTVERDLALILSEETEFAKIEENIRKAGGSKINSVELFDIYRDSERLGDGLKSYAVNLVFSDPEKTMKDKEVDKIVGKILHLLEKNTGAKLR